MSDNIKKDRKAIVEFKRECRSYFYYVADVREVMLDIKRVDQKMQGVSSLDFQKPHTGPKKRWRKSKIIDYIEVNSALKRKLNEREKKIRYVLDMISQFEPPSFRPIIWRIYVQRERMDTVADDYMMSKDYMAMLISDEFGRLFPEQEGEELVPSEDDETPEAVL